MKDPIRATKNAYKTLLKDAVSYNGTVLPTYVAEADKAGGDIYIVIGTLTDTNLPQKSMFMSQTTCLIEVLAKLPYGIEDAYEVVDVVTEQILNLAIPSIGNTGLVDTDDFSFRTVARESSEHLAIEDLGSGRLVRRVTRFSQILIQK